MRYLSVLRNKFVIINTIFRHYSNKSVPTLPKCDFIADNSQSRLGRFELEAIHRVNLSPALIHLYKEPVVITQAKGQYVWDNQKRYLDMFAGIVTTSVGHCHPSLVENLSKQLSKVWHTSSLYYNEEVHEYASNLANRFPEPLNSIFFCNSGSEANDIAILMARLYTESHDIIALRNAYHGMSLSTQSLCGIGTWKYQIPSYFNVHHTTNPDPYRGRFGGANCRDSIIQTTRECDCGPDECKACDLYIEDLEQLMNTTLPKKIAAFFAESIQGVGGTVQYPKQYLKRALDLVHQRGGLFISDEVQTGFGRTGTHFWGFEGHDILPDIVTMAKGIGNGFPMAAVITRQEIAHTLTSALYFNTYGGNPLSATVGLTVLDIIDEENLQQNSEVVGSKLLRGLAKLRDQYPKIVGDVRGKGLMIGVEMINGCANKRQPMVKSDFDLILEDCKQMGLLIGRGGPNGNVFRIKPPMCVTEEDIDFTLEVLDKSFQSHYERNAKYLGINN